MNPRLVLLASMLAGSPAAAQQLADPMRPPGTAQAAAETAPAPAAPSGLQTVLISGTRRIAVIDGEAVAVGDRARGLVVVEIGETAVTLRKGAQRLILRLVPRDMKQERSLRERVEPIRAAQVDTNKDARP